MHGVLVISMAETTHPKQSQKRQLLWGGHKLK